MGCFGCKSLIPIMLDEDTPGSQCEATGKTVRNPEKAPNFCSLDRRLPDLKTAVRLLEKAPDPADPCPVCGISLTTPRKMLGDQVLGTHLAAHLGESMGVIMRALHRLNDEQLANVGCGRVSQEPVTVLVHSAHCCIRHGCKYGDEGCPVVLEIVTQQGPCNDCEADDNWKIGKA